MGNINENNEFDETVHQIEADEELEGGAGGNLNKAAQALADRTQYLKGKTDGNHTITDATAPTGSTETIDKLLGFLANMIKAITGKNSWMTAPATSLQSASNHINNTSDPHETMKQIYYIGCVIYNTVSNANPNTYLGFGTWASYGPGRVIVGASNAFALGATGGAATHTLTSDELPSHSHMFGADDQVGSQGGYNDAAAGFGYDADSRTNGGGRNLQTKEFQTRGNAHNNMQPYIVAYRWTRTA